MEKTGMIITAKAGCFAVRTPRKDDIFLDRLKRMIPKEKRSWDPESFVWLVDPSFKRTLQSVIELSGYAMPKFPDINPGVVATVEKTFILEYLGQCKEREGGAITALGMIAGYWSIEIPEDLLIAFFKRNGEAKLITDDQTLYQTLCVFETATDPEIKSAYRRLARQWHPDTCSEPEAAEMFMRIDGAYKKLSNAQTRVRYDAGLYFEREAAKKAMSAKAQPPATGRKRFFNNDHYRAPLRCGQIVVEGVQRMNKFMVSRIVAWADATDEYGRVMCSSWDKESRSVKIRWI